MFATLAPGLDFALGDGKFNEYPGIFCDAPSGIL
jgi:hypothetical protein